MYNVFLRYTDKNWDPCVFFAGIEKLKNEPT